ncbi:hypothetical protein NXS19_011562 [Fusarium pseudograminearum]|nr:hypothetical protein NXS19_011562 [Fusarium pseudograminearum]
MERPHNQSFLWTASKMKPSTLHWSTMGLLQLLSFQHKLNKPFPHLERIRHSFRLAIWLRLRLSPSCCTRVPVDGFYHQSNLSKQVKPTPDSLQHLSSMVHGLSTCNRTPTLPTVLTSPKVTTQMRASMGTKVLFRFPQTPGLWSSGRISRTYGCSARYWHLPTVWSHGPLSSMCPLLAQALKPRLAKPALKSRWMDEEKEKEESDECPEDPAKKSSKNASRLKSRAARAKAARRKRNIQQVVDPSNLPYRAFEQLLAWNTKDGCEIAYLPAGQLDEEVLFTAKELRDYLQQCPRKPKIWLQNTPSKCKGRHIDADVKCRYSECPAKNGTILHGWHRVAFDEFPEMTSEGAKDPFKMAGVMHLWCFEQCIDPLEPIEQEVLFPDERELPKEKLNRMAITRDDYKDVIDEAIKPWIKERRRVGVVQVPYSKHEDTLSWALCNFHVKKQNRARERMREQRNQNRLDDEKKTVELIMGDLSEYHRRLELSRARKRAILLMQQNTLYEQQHNLLYGSIVARPMFKPEPPVGEEITVHVPECAAQDEEEIPPLNPDLISDAEIAAFIKECAAPADAADRPRTPQSLGAGVQVLESPSSVLPHPHAEIQDSIAIPDSPVSMDSLFGSPTKTQESVAIPDSITVQEGSPAGSVSSTGSRKRSRTEEDAAAPEAKKRRQTPSPTLRSPKVSSPLRRSSRFSLGSRSSPRRNNGSVEKRVSM